MQNLVNINKDGKKSQSSNIQIYVVQSIFYILVQWNIEVIFVSLYFFSFSVVLQL